MAEPQVVILVHSTSHALRAENLLNRAEIRSRLIPVPRHLSSSCGVCLRIAAADREAAVQCLEGAGMDLEGVYEV
jgi:hypothetical protein